MRILFLCALYAFVATFAAQASTFVEDFSQGVRAPYWTISETRPDIYTWNTHGGSLNFSKVGVNPGGLNHIALNLQMDAFGGQIEGDFDVSVDCSNVVFDGSTTGYQQIELHTMFADSSIFFDVYSPEQGGPYAAHVWDGGFRGLVKSSATSGVFRISRVSNTLSGYWNGSLIYSKSSAAALTSVRMVLQNNAGNNSDISCGYDNFTLSGPNITDRVNFVSGHVVLSDFVGDVASRTIDVRFAPTDGGSDIIKTGVPIDADGRFSTHVYGIGDATPYVVSRGFLRKALPAVTLPGGGGQVTGLEATLINGDVDSDDAVTVFDYNMMSDAFDSVPGDPNWLASADLDGDGAVTVFDYNVLSNNFDLVGD